MLEVLIKIPFMHAYPDLNVYHLLELYHFLLTILTLFLYIYCH